MSKKFSGSAVIASAIIIGQLLSNSNIGALAKSPVQKVVASQESETPTISDETINGKTYYVTRALVKAKPDMVWQILTDYHHAVQVFPLLKKCELIEDHGSTKVTKHEIAPSGIPDTFEYTLEVKEIAPKLMEWRRIKW